MKKTTSKIKNKMKVKLLNYILLCSIVTVRTNEIIKDTDEVNEIFNQSLLDEGEKTIKLLGNIRNVTLVLGNIGSGKSTLLHWLAEDNSYLFTDEKNMQIKESSFFPELVVENSAGIAYYNLPGFSRNLTTSEDITSHYFIKKVTDHIRFVKILLVLKYPLGTNKVDQTDLLKLLRHVTHTIKKIEKYQNSIAIAITNFNNSTHDVVLKNVADLFESALKDLNNKITHSGVSKHEKEFCHKAIILIKTFLLKRNTKFIRIGIFRIPNEAESINNSNMYLKIAKKEMQSVLLDELLFTTKDKADFGYSLSRKSLADVNKINEVLLNNVLNYSQRIQTKILSNYRKLSHDILSKINLFLNEKVVSAKQNEARHYSAKLVRGYKVVSAAFAEDKNLTNIGELALAIKQISTELHLDSIEDEKTHLLLLEKYFSFLQLVFKEKLHNKDWSLLFSDTISAIFSLKNNVLTDASTISKIIRNSVSYNIEKLAEAIFLHFEKQSNGDVEHSISVFSEGVLIISDLCTEIQNFTNAQLFSNTVKRNILLQNIPEVHIWSNSILHLGKYIDYLAIINHEIFTFAPETWTNPFNKLKNSLSNEKVWYTFLNDFYSKFSKYETKNLIYLHNLFDNINAKVAVKMNDDQENYIKNQFFQDFLQKIAKYTLKNFEEVKNIKITEKKFNELRDVFSSVIVRKHYVNCSSNGEIRIMGKFLTLSDFVDINDRVVNLCETVTNKIRSLILFAEHTVFFDRNIDAEGHELHVTIAAPNWHIIGNRIIKLDGYAGTNVIPKKASSGQFYGRNGEDGKPGNPGGNGGSFFGIANTILDGRRLKISACGGNGSNGQDGGNGKEGEDGLSATASNSSFEHTSEFLINDLTLFGGKTLIRYHYYGKDGSNGGVGGDGGRGGYGGYGGNIMLITNQKIDLPLLTKEDGVNGSDGNGGYGGIGGSPGTDQYWHTCFYIELKHTSMFPFPLPFFHSSGGPLTVPTFHSGDRCEPTTNFIGSANFGDDGISGQNGKNVHGMIYPSKPFEPRNKEDIILSFKEFLYEYLEDKFSNKFLMYFLKKLNENTEAIKVYTTVTFVQEYEFFEKLNIKNEKISKSTKFIFYHSLLDRIIDFVEQMPINNLYKENKKILSYVYTATLSKLNNLKQDAGHNLIINIHDYIASLNQDIEYLKNIKDINRRLSITNKHKNNYKSSLNKKINEAESFIKEEIILEIDNIHNQISSQINEFIKEIFDLKQQSIKEKNILLEKKKRMETTFISSICLGVFKIIGDIASTFVGIGQAVSSVINTSVQVSKNLGFVNNQATNSFSLPQGVLIQLKNCFSKINKVRDAEFENFENYLNQVSKEIPKNFTDILKNIENYKSETKLARKTFNMSQLRETENKFKNQLSNNKDLLKTNYNKTQAISAVDNLNFVLHFGEMGSQIISSVKEYKENIEHIDEAIVNIDEGIKLLKTKENDIFDIMIPILKVISDDLGSALKKMENASKVHLDITRWNVQGSLRDLKLKMRQFTEGFHVEPSLGRFIEKLEEAMTTATLIYDKIQNYQDQKLLADYIADISESTSISIEITDPTLKKAVTQLDETITSNLVVEQYKQAVNALAQQVFPFAHLYLSKTILPKQLELEKDFQKVIDETTRHIEIISKELSLYKSTIRYPDKDIRTGWFSGDYESSTPFFVWNSVEYGDTIKAFLSGKRIVLKANVLNSPFGKQAIKFSSINLKVRSKNQTITSIIQQKLERYILSAKHLGNSYYKFDNRIYLITCESQDIEFSFEKDINGLRIHKNGVYAKIESGDITLSPYTMWTFQLINATNKYHFEEFNDYEDIDLELEGFGTYIVDKAKEYYGDLSLYYKEVGVTHHVIIYDDSSYKYLENSGSTVPVNYG